MIMSQLKMAASVALAIGLIGGGLLAYQALPGYEEGAKTDMPKWADGESAQVQAKAKAPLEKPFENAPACHWLFDPGNLQFGGGGTLFMGTAETIAAIVETDKNAAVQVTLAWKVSRGKPGPELRPVAFDAQRKRYLFTGGGGSCEGYAPLENDGVSMHRFSTDPGLIRAEKVAYIGVEVVTPEAHLIQARQAVEQAREAGIDVLPYPEIGKAYDFVLKTHDGRKIRLNDLKGKVVLLDFWTCG